MADEYATLPARLTRDEVLALARYGPATLARRVTAGVMPQPVDRGLRGQGIFNRDDVLVALKLRGADYGGS